MKKTLSIFVVLFLFTFCGMAQGYKNPIIFIPIQVFAVQEKTIIL